MSESHDSLLEGVRVVELSQGARLAAPLLGMLLAEQGAEVVRVVDPREPPADPVLDALLARGKTELRLDRGDPESVQLLPRLLRQADVALEDGDSPVDLDRLRAEHNPGLVCCSLPAFPADDPRAKLPAHEAVAGAAGFLYNKPLGRPRFHRFPIGSITAALYGAGAVVAALYARLSLGQGQRIEVPLCYANLCSQVVQILIKAGVPRGFLPLKMIGSPFMRCWLCQDERYVYLHITLPTHNAQMLETLEQSGYAAEVAELRGIMSEETMRDPSQVRSIAEAKKIKAVYTRIFLSKPADAWEEILGKDLCCIKVRTVEEWLRDSLEAGMTDACEVEDPVFGTLLGPGPCVAAPDHPPVVRPRRVDEGAVSELLARWQAEPRPAPAGVARKGAMERSDQGHRAPLEGVKVLDLSRVIAGPCAARVLAELGAEVLSVQSATRLDWALSFHLMFNAGKRSVTLDFTTDEGKRRFWKLYDWYGPDALIHNYRHLDLAREIGVGPESVLERRPGTAYTHLNAYGNHGVWQHRPGFEQVVQAVSGIQMAYAESGRPKLLPSPIIDIGCGLLGAFGTLLGLYHERRTGKGAVVATHLTSVSVLLQLLSVSEFQRDACLARARERGLDARFDEDGEVLAGVFLTLSGFALLAGPRRDIRRWLDSLAERGGTLARGGNSGTPGAPRRDARNRNWRSPAARWSGATKDAELELAGSKLYRGTVAHWQQSLVDAGVQDSVAILAYPSIRRSVEDIRRFDRRPQPAIRKRRYPGTPQDLVFVANPTQLSLTPLADVAPPPERGADTFEVLRQAGIDVPPGSGPIPYPPNKSLPVWLGSFIRWGYFAWKSGNI
jgi:crotonobetainyl-CoA:carnitine CoA-transferase CaiB-like acyl-CoA transferase